MLCVLAKNCDEPMYVKLVEALCKEHSINLIRVCMGWIVFASMWRAMVRKMLVCLQVDDNKKLGEWVGLCKIDKEGKPRKVVRCSCVVVKVRVEDVEDKMESRMGLKEPACRYRIMERRQQRTKR